MHGDGEGHRRALQAASAPRRDRLLKHGGGAPQVRHALAERVAEQKAVRLAAQLDIDVSKFDGDPRRALAESLIIAQSWAARSGFKKGDVIEASASFITALGSAACAVTRSAGASPTHDQLGEQVAASNSTG